MVDLSQVRGRTDVQDQRFTRDDTILPTRRVQDAPSVQVDANIRNGVRGDGAVEELRQTLGLVDQTQTQLVNLNQTQQAQTEKQNAEIAAGDTVSGNVNQDLMQKSLAYRMVIANGRADAVAAQAEAEARTTALNQVNAAANADPTKGDQVVGLPEVNQTIDNVFKQHVLDAQGQPIDFGDPSANVRLYRRLQQAREHILGVAAENIRAQEQSKASDAVGSAMQAGLLKGDSNALESGIKQLTDLGIDIKQAKNTALHAALDAALNNKSVDPLARALSSTREDGTPTFSQEEQNTLLTAKHTYANQFEEEHNRDVERTSMATIGNLAIDAAAGKSRITPDVVRNLVDTGQIGAQYADKALQLQYQLDSEANSRSEWGRQATLQGLDISRARLGLAEQQAQDKAEGIFAAALQGGMNGAQLQGKLIDAAAAGQLDSKTFVRASELAKSIQPDTGMVAQYHAEDHLVTLKQALTDLDTTRQARARQGQHVPTDDQFTTIRDHTYFAFYQNLRKGMANGDALRAALGGTGALSKAQIDTYVNRASAGMSANDMKTQMREATKAH